MTFPMHTENRCQFVRGLLPRKAMNWLARLAFALVLLFTAGETSAQVIRRVSAPGKFYVDNKLDGGVPADIIYNYAIYTISNNTATTFPGMYVAITNIVSTNRVQLAPTDTG